MQSGLCLDAGGDGKVVSTCDMLPYKHSTFCNHSLTPYQRAAALVAGSNLTNQIDNLGIPALGYTSEGMRTVLRIRSVRVRVCACVRVRTYKCQKSYVDMYACFSRDMLTFAFQ